MQIYIRMTGLIIVFIVGQSLRFLAKLGVEGLFPIVTVRAILGVSYSIWTVLVF